MPAHQPALPVPGLEQLGHQPTNLPGYSGGTVHVHCPDCRKDFRGEDQDKAHEAFRRGHGACR